MSVHPHGDDTTPIEPSTTPPVDTTVLATVAADLLREVRAREPLVQVVTNAVVTNVTANVLLALGASPAMCDVPGEAGPFAQVADGLLVNLGTPHAEQRAGALEAASAARDAGTPWVLDPVAVGTLRGLTSTPATALELMDSYAASWRQTLWRVRFPAAIPQMVPAFRLAASASVVGVVAVMAGLLAHEVRCGRDQSTERG